MGMAANLGAHVDGGKKGTEGMDKNVVIDGGSKGSDVSGGVISNVTVEWDEAEKVLVYIFLLQAPKLLVVLVNDCVLMWVVVVGGGASGSGEEMWEEVGSSGVCRRFDGKRWERSGWLRSGGTGRRYTLDGGEGFRLW